MQLKTQISQQGRSFWQGPLLATHYRISRLAYTCLLVVLYRDQMTLTTAFWLLMLLTSIAEAAGLKRVRVLPKGKETLTHNRIE